MRANLDPNDVEALEKSLNDSAARVSSIWISFLVFGLYLIIAAGGTTHRQLFMEEPIKLPVLSIDLSLFGFYALAPLLFVIFHAYVLLQVLLLARTAEVYNEAVERTFPVTSDRTRVRQRLANTLFAQIFAGSPREREGLLGAVLRLIAWLTLAILPVAVLLTFEFKFLAYHSYALTWTHRISIAIDLIIVLLLWRAALDARQNVSWRSAFRPHPAVFMAFALALISWVAVSFPGELHANWTRFGNTVPPECNVSWFGPLDRLSLSRENFVEEQLAKIEARAKQGGLSKAYLGERTRSFRSRNLSCGEFKSVDLRRADFANANMRGGVFSDILLQGASLDDADLTGARLEGFENRLQETSFVGAMLEAADLRGAWLARAHLAAAQLRGANLSGAELQGARLTGAQLQGANLNGASLQGADLRAARLQAATLIGAKLEGADLGPYGSATVGRYEWPLSISTRLLMITAYVASQLGSLGPLPTLEGKSEYSKGEWSEETHLQGADLKRAVLRGAVLRGARLEGANLSQADLDAADLSETQLQGAQLDNGLLRLTLLRQAHVWRATGAQCNDAQVMESQIAVPSGAVQIERFIEEVGREVPEPAKQRLRARLRERLKTDTIDDQANERIWRDCESKALTRDEWERRHANFLIADACGVKGAIYLTEALSSRLINEVDRESPSPYIKVSSYTKAVARGLLGIDRKPCSNANELRDEVKEELRSLAGVKTEPQ